MLKQYFSDGLLQIAILLSILRTDLINFSAPNNELLNYPEVQDILQGQTMAYVSTDFHNHYNSLDTIPGYSLTKYADTDSFYFSSSLFRELQRFRRGVPQSIEAFLVSNDGTVVFEPPQANGGQSSSSASTTLGSQTASAGNSNSAASTEDDNNNNGPDAVAIDNSGFTAELAQAMCGDFSNCPFPGLTLSPEDLDLIEVLWRQDVDLGAGKEVFDPNLRRELEHEREIELHKEQEKRKLAEKREREQQQLNEQWLSENFTRDGETGELIPIAGNGSTNASYSSSGPSSYYPETGAQAQASAYNFDGSNHSSQVNHTYGQPIHHQQDAVAPLLPDSLLFLDSQPDEPQLANLTQEEELPSEEDWAELVGYLDSALNQTTSAINITSTTTIVNTNIIMPPVESQAVIVPATATTTTTTTNNMNEPQLYYNHQYQQQQQQQQYDNLFNFDQTPTLSSSASMNETLHLLRQNSTGSGSSILAGLLNQTEPALVHNVTLPLAVGLDNAPHPLSGLVEPLSDDQDAMPQDLNSTLAGTDGGDLTSGDFQDIFPNLMELANLTNNMDPSDILSGLSEEDMAGLASAGLENIQLPDDAGSDSAISMGSASPNQDVNETMDMSPFDGLEGATGGSDFEATDYGNQRTHSYSSGGAEDDGYHYSCSSYGSPASVNTNYSTGSNDTEHSSSLSSTSLGHVHHNHTYNTLPGHTPREVKKYAKRDGPRMKGPQSRDTKRAEALKIPFTVERIIHAPVEEFNDMMTKFKLTDAQANLMRDIRRRGKNKVAAQNCRKRKLDVIVDLSDDLSGMQRARDKLAAERRRVEEERRQAKEHYNKLYKAIFSSLRDEQGRPYDPDQYSLQHGADGNVFLVHLSNLTAAAPVPMPIASGSGAGPSRRSGKRKEGGGVQSHKKKNKE